MSRTKWPKILYDVTNAEAELNYRPLIIDVATAMHTLTRRAQFSTNIFT
jgi:hypothetical protein